MENGSCAVHTALGGWAMCVGGKGRGSRSINTHCTKTVIPYTMRLSLSLFLVCPSVHPSIHPSLSHTHAHTHTHTHTQILAITHTQSTHTHTHTHTEGIRQSTHVNKHQRNITDGHSLLSLVFLCKYCTFYFYFLFFGSLCRSISIYTEIANFLTE